MGSCCWSGEGRTDVTRRNFLLGAASALPVLARGDSGTSSETVRFCAFADLHYAPGLFPHDEPAWLERIIARAKANKAEFIIHLGDLMHDPAKHPEFVARYKDCGLPAYHTLGNHDTEGCSLRETLAAYGLDSGHYHFDRGGFRFVVFDSNYFISEGRYVHFERNNYRKIPTRESWQIPPEQIEWGRRTIAESPYPCVLFSHQSEERESGAWNWPDFRRMVDEANAAQRGKVRLVINGHHHTDNVRILDGVVYLDLNSANYKYYDKSHRLYGTDYLKTHPGARNVIAWNDPISAIITLSTDGRMKIEGERSSFFMGVTPEKAGFPKRDRLIAPNIQSFEVCFRY